MEYRKFSRKALIIGYYKAYRIVRRVEEAESSLSLQEQPLPPVLETALLG